MTLADSADGSDYKDRLAKRLKRVQRQSYAAIKAAHYKQWNAFHHASSITVPDETYQHIYNISAYVIKSCNHPTGGLSVGVLPMHWSGGTHCPYDAFYMHQAMCATNRGQTLPAITWISIRCSVRPVAPLPPSSKRPAQRIRAGPTASAITWAPANAP